MTKKFLFKIFIPVGLLIFIIIASVLTSCKCRACNDQEEATVPVEILAKADSFIIKTTGKEFFNKYITADFYRTKVTPPYYELAYKFFIPEKPYVNAIIKFTVDSIGM